MGAFHFAFEQHVPVAAAEMSLHLAMFAAEGLVGRVRVRLGANYVVDETAHAIDIDGDQRVTQLVSRVFAGLLLREFGEEAFRMDHLSSDQREPQEAAA